MSGDGSDQRDDEAVKSLNGDAVSPVRFHNKTGRPVNLIWVDYQGNRKVQIELEKGQEVNFNTYVTHPWLAQDTHSKRSLLLNYSGIYYPPSPEVRRVNFRERRSLVRRTVVTITTPVHRLERYCRDAIQGLVEEQNIKDLPLPPLVIRELLEVRHCI